VTTLLSPAYPSRKPLKVGTCIRHSITTLRAYGPRRRYRWQPKVTEAIITNYMTIL